MTGRFTIEIEYNDNGEAAGLNVGIHLGAFASRANSRSPPPVALLEGSFLAEYGIEHRDQLRSIFGKPIDHAVRYVFWFVTKRWQLRGRLQ
jgi:hypothetical protein